MNRFQEEDLWSEGDRQHGLVRKIVDSGRAVFLHDSGRVLSQRLVCFPLRTDRWADRGLMWEFCVTRLRDWARSD